MEAIRMRGLYKRHGETDVLAGVDLVVERGTILALLGPNGAGKTTLVRILSTLAAPDSGTAAILGIDVTSRPHETRALIGLTGQSAAVDEVLTGEENLRMIGRLLGLTRAGARERAAELLQRFSLSDAASRRVRDYSGGMRRRLDLAVSLVVPPPVLFLDEPTTGLDLPSRRALWAVIRSLRDEGTTVLLTTQYLEEADELADRIAVLRSGRIVAEGTAAQLKARIGGEMVELRAADGTLVAERQSDGTLGGLRRAIDELEAGGAGGTVSLRTTSLDDVFISLTEGGPDAAASAPTTLQESRS